MYPSHPTNRPQDETLDSMLQGCLKIIQPRKGYRFSIDSMLLAGLTRIRPRERVVDLGTGCGVVPLLLALQQPVARVTGIEIQESLASMAKRSVELNGLSHLIRIFQVDLRQIPGDILEKQATLVVSNPPYRELHSGRLNPEMDKAVARHEIAATLGDVVLAAARLLPQGGRLALIYPSRRLAHLFREVSRRDFTPKRLIPIYATRRSPAKLVHLESVKGGGEELQLAEPFVIYRDDGSYSPEMAAIYGNGPAVS